jgi:undecaprenyl-diphosphatase
MQRYLELDARLSQQLRTAESPGLWRSWNAVLAHSGDSWFLLIGLLVVWLLGTPYWRQRAVIMAISIVITAIVVMVIKFTVRRSRPEGEWGAIYRSTDPHSFPSGHAARAAMLAILALGLGPTWLAVVLLIWAPLVAFARVAMGLHYLSDVLVGALIGIVIALIILSFV